MEMASDISTQFLFFSDGTLYNVIRSKDEFAKLFEFIYHRKTISQDFHETEEETKFSKIHAPSFLPADPYLLPREEDIFLKKKKRYINFPTLAISMWHRSTREKFTGNIWNRTAYLERSRLSFKAERVSLVVSLS